MLGVDGKACERTKDNVLKAAKTAAFIKYLTNGNDILILLAGAEAGAGALVSIDTLDCYKDCTGKIKNFINNVE